jgi:hypothetical protein
MPALREVASGQFAACHYPIAGPAAEVQLLAAAIA